MVGIVAADVRQMAQRLLRFGEARQGVGHPPVLPRTDFPGLGDAILQHQQLDPVLVKRGVCRGDQGELPAGIVHELALVVDGHLLGDADVEDVAAAVGDPVEESRHAGGAHARVLIEEETNLLDSCEQSPQRHNEKP